MITKFYEPSPKGEKNSGGYIVEKNPKETATLIKEKRYSEIDLHLKNGPHRSYGFLFDFNLTVIICEEWKLIIEKYLDEKSGIDFIPVTVKSEEYGDRRQFLVIFNKTYDVVDLKHSKTIEDPFSVVVPVLQYEKVQDLPLFYVPKTIYRFVMNAKIYREIKKNKLTFGVCFSPVWAISKDDPKY